MLCTTAGKYANIHIAYRTANLKPLGANHIFGIRNSLSGIAPASREQKAGNRDPPLNISSRATAAVPIGCFFTAMKNQDNTIIRFIQLTDDLAIEDADIRLPKGLVLPVEVPKGTNKLEASHVTLPAIMSGMVQAIAEDHEESAAYRARRSCSTNTP